jgi:2-methylcitrate dehydratase PrpD
MSQPLTRELVQIVRKIQYDTIPADVLTKTKYCILDYIADAVAGKAANLPSVEIAYQYACLNGGREEATVIGTNRKLPAAEAAFVNSISGEVLELGDGENSVIGHPGQAVVPAALAVSEREGGISGKKFIEAVLAGYEAFIFVGRSIMPQAYDSGFSASASLGNIGGAVAVGRLYGFNDEKIKDAIALSAYAGGYLRSWNLTGTMDKDLMVADSTRRGVLSAILAQMGYNGSDAILEGRLGFCEAMCGEPNQVTRKPGEYFIRTVYFKPYPCCRDTHGNVDAALALYREGVDVDQIEKILIQTDTRGSTVSIAHPKSFVAIRFSQQYATAVTLLTGQATTHEFTEEFAERRDVEELLNKMTMEIDPELDIGWPERDCSRRITLTMRDGSVRTSYIRDTKGSAEYPMTCQDVEGKCRGLLAAKYSEKRIDEIVATVLSLEKLQSMGELIMFLGE